MIQRKAGSTSVILPVHPLDAASTRGAGKTGLAYNTAGLTCYYKRDTGTAAVAVTLANITTLGTFVSGGFKALDGTNMPGAYEFHPPDAAMAAGAKWVLFFFRGATDLADSPVLVELTATDNQDAAGGGMTRLVDIQGGVEALVEASDELAGLALFGTVAASPTPTSTAFTVTLSAGSTFSGVAADLVGQSVTFLGGARHPNAAAITAATVNSSTSLALTVTALPAAPAATDRVLISE